MPVMYDQPLSRERCAKLESALRLSLPEDYKNFLCKWNGIFVSLPDWVNLPFDKVYGGEIAFTALFGFCVANKNFNIVEMNANLKDDIAHLGNVVVIGDDGGDNYFVLLQRSNYYSVFYWDRTHLHGDSVDSDCDIQEQDECGNLYFVSETFDDFWMLLSGHLANFQYIMEPS